MTTESNPSAARRSTVTRSPAAPRNTCVSLYRPSFSRWSPRASEPSTGRSSSSRTSGTRASSSSVYRPVLPGSKDVTQAVQRPVSVTATFNRDRPVSPSWSSFVRTAPDGASTASYVSKSSDRRSAMRVSPALASSA